MTQRTISRPALAAALLAPAAAQALAQCFTSGTAWKNTSFASQGGAFTATFDAIPGMNKMDGVTGLSNGPATGFAGAAAIVRFNNAGTIDARNGGVYAAAAKVPYTAGSRYRFRVAVNPASRTYSVWVTPPGGSEVPLASNYAFRTEQASVSSFNDWSLFADAGTHQVCGFAIASSGGGGAAAPPAVVINSPANGAAVSGLVHVAATASGSPGVANVQFAADGTPIGAPVAAAPYATTWDTRGVSNGSHVLRAEVTDRSGGKASSSISVNVRNAAPAPPPAAGCVTSAVAWQSAAIPSQGAPFEASFDATPSAANVDAVTGLSRGAASGYSSLATVVRFNNTGTIDARNGASYAAAARVPYSAGAKYHFRMDVDPASHTYSVWVTPPGGAETALAPNYSFRSEQASVSSLDHWALESDAGTHQVCAFAVSDVSGGTTGGTGGAGGTGGTTPPPVTSNYDATVLADKPIAFWAMKNPAGAEADLTGNGHAGTYKGGVPALTTLPDGEPVVDFNTVSGQQQYMTVPSPADKGFSISTTRQLTWEAWIRPDVLQFSRNTGSGYVDWMGKCQYYGGNSASPCEWEARMYSTTTGESPNRPNRVSGYVFNAGAGLGSAADWQPAYVNGYASSIVQAKRWLHVVVEYQTVNNAGASGCGTPAGTVNIWVNGVPWSQASHAPTGCFSQFKVTPSAGNSPLDIGTMAMDSWFQGAIGKVAIYNTLLSPARITAHYAAMTGAQPSGSCGSTCTATFPASK